jgi:two-component system sensor histidine kinase YesM
MEEIRQMLDNKDDYETNNIGMRNIHMRLQLTYGPECGLILASQSGFGTQISFAIPLRSGSYV